MRSQSLLGHVLGCLLERGILPSSPGAVAPVWPSDHEDTHVTHLRRSAANAAVVPFLALALAGCGSDAASPTPPDESVEAISSPGAGPATADTDLTVIGCATDDPAGVGELTGAWQGSDRGVYYIRQVGDCVWWFGTELEDIEPGQTAQRGFANVASGRLVGTQLDLEWADIPLGNILGGGGLTFVYDQENEQLTLTEQRGEWEPFGGSVLTRIEPPASPDSSPGASATP